MGVDEVGVRRQSIINSAGKYNQSMASSEARQDLQFLMFGANKADGAALKLPASIFLVMAAHPVLVSPAGFGTIF